jgi:hypothetical protein
LLALRVVVVRLKRTWIYFRMAFSSSSSSSGCRCSGLGAWLLLRLERMCLWTAKIRLCSRRRGNLATAFSCSSDALGRVCCQLFLLLVLWCVSSFPTCATLWFCGIYRAVMLLLLLLLL